ncbi:MAG TPA: FAD/NAD(P)-binding oxidoreductase [Candidatus Limnocylindrales bacterium]|nr:FAD/NAD(P)-binding oxidoreductase [Candidatus Limnocylindrales bacterium]
MADGAFDFDIVVIGGGPAGLAAASTAAENGRRVALIDETPWLGGQIWRGQQSRPLLAAARSWFERFKRSGATHISRASVIAFPASGVLLAENVNGPIQVHWQRLILATGARELFLPFPGWTLPGIIGPGGLQTLIKHGWPVAGQRVVVAGSGPLLLVVADSLKRKGARVVTVAEQAAWNSVMRFGRALGGHAGKVWQALNLRLRLVGTPCECGVWPVRAEGTDTIQSVTLTDGNRVWTESCTLLACGFGLVPNIELALALGCELTDNCVKVNAQQATTVSGIYCAGEPTGIGGVDCALVEGQIAGCSAAGKEIKAEKLFAKRASWHKFRAALAEAFTLRPEVKTLASDSTLLCRCEDVSLGRMRQFSTWREAKLQSRCGMGACQGRICGAAAKFILGWGMESVRPPLLPARVGNLISEQPCTSTKPPC